ncbi:MAG TPA: DASS family sodium-coupled anion symporter, partial [Parachlamydiaceae bacterium]|nr:DASS family sodium-coupled anion symporter [Parachlamydiaceae bacterium]
MQDSHAKKPVYTGVKLVPFLLSIAIGASIWLTPTPIGVEPKAWQLLAIFAALIVGLIGKALPMGGLSFLALTLLIATNTLTMKEAFSGFSHPIIWLVVSAFLISKSFIKTGFGMRIAYHFVRFFGKKTLGLSYGITATELFLSPAIPSATARAGGIIFPIVKSLAISFGSTPERHSQRLIGSYLILTAYYVNLITSAMFVTAMAGNPLVIAILQDMGINLTWGSWALAASLPGILSLVLVPYIVYKLYPPTITSTPEAKKIADEHLQKMGPISLYEWITFAVFVMLVTLWIFGEPYFGLESTTVALMGVSI